VENEIVWFWVWSFEFGVSSSKFQVGTVRSSLFTIYFSLVLAKDNDRASSHRHPVSDQRDGEKQEEDGCSVQFSVVRQSSGVPRH